MVRLSFNSSAFTKLPYFFIVAFSCANAEAATKSKSGKWILRNMNDRLGVGVFGFGNLAKVVKERFAFIFMLKFDDRDNAFPQSKKKKGEASP